MCLVISLCLSKGKSDVAATVSLNNALLRLSMDDFVTGERFVDLSDVAIYTRDYAHNYPSVKLHANFMILVDEALDARAIQAIARSKVFFIKPDSLDSFVEIILPLITQRFILLSHLSDMDAGTVKSVLNIPNLHKWYGCNMYPHMKTKSVPLGLENADMWKRTNFSEVISARTNEKNKMLYVYFNTKSNEIKRSQALSQLVDNGFKVQGRAQWSEYINDLSKYKFCASPEGNGVDTHRMWECLYLGVIPIVIKTPELYNWYSDLPILWITSFKGVTPEFLRGVRIVEDKSARRLNTGLYSVSLIRNSLAVDIQSL